MLSGIILSFAHECLHLKYEIKYKMSLDMKIIWFLFHFDKSQLIIIVL